MTEADRLEEHKLSLKNRGLFFFSTHFKIDSKLSEKSVKTWKRD